MKIFIVTAVTAAWRWSWYVLKMRKNRYNSNLILSKCPMFDCVIWKSYQQELNLWTCQTSKNILVWTSQILNWIKETWYNIPLNLWENIGKKEILIPLHRLFPQTASSFCLLANRIFLPEFPYMFRTGTLVPECVRD